MTLEDNAKKECFGSPRGQCYSNSIELWIFAFFFGRSINCGAERTYRISLAAMMWARTWAQECNVSMPAHSCRTLQIFLFPYVSIIFIYLLVVCRRVPSTFTILTNFMLGKNGKVMFKLFSCVRICGKTIALVICYDSKAVREDRPTES